MSVEAKIDNAEQKDEQAHRSHDNDGDEQWKFVIEQAVRRLCSGRTGGCGTIAWSVEINYTGAHLKQNITVRKS